MGILNKLITWNKERRNRIVTWFVIGFGGLFLLIGIILVSVTPSTRALSEINLTGEGLTEGSGIYQYYLDIRGPTTSITVNPTPRTATAVVSFTSDSHLITLPATGTRGERVPANGTLFINLNRHMAGSLAGQFQFGEASVNRQNIVITAQSGSVTVRILARIVVTPHEPTSARVEARLERRPSHLSNLPTNWSSVGQMSSADFFNNTAFYRVVADFFTFDEPSPRFTSSIAAHTSRFSFDPTDYFESSILNIFNPNPTATSGLGFTFNNPLGHDAHFDVTISFTFDGVEYFTQAPLRIILSV